VRSWFFVAIALFALLRFGSWFTSPSEHPAIAWDRATIQQETAVGELPDRRLTPGAIASTSAAQVCQRGYARRTRHPYDSEWRRLRVEMFRRYGIPHDDWARYVVDHLVPITDGGSPFDLNNIWPELKDEAERKDARELSSHRHVCNGEASLQEVQREFENDWTTVKP
jgi:hypothetical protein